MGDPTGRPPAESEVIDDVAAPFDLPVAPLPVSLSRASHPDPDRVVSYEAPADPLPVDGHPAVPSDLELEAPSPDPYMRRYVLPWNGDPVLVVPAVPFRRSVWILARGEGGLQTAYNSRFSDPDYADVQVNGIPIPLFAGQDLWLRVEGADQGNDLEVSLVVEPRGAGR